MKASSHEKHSKQQWKKQKKNKKKVQTHGQGLGRGLAGDMGLNFLFFFGFSMVFCSLAKTSRTQKKNKKKSSDPWARSGLSTHKLKNQKTKKPKNQKTKNNKKTKKTRPNTLHLTPSPWGVQSCFFCFFGFLVFWFFGFLVFWFFGLCVDSPDLAHGSELFVFFVFFCVLEVLAKLQKTMEKPKKQKNKKPRNQKTKKPKKTKKTRLHTPRGGGQMQSVGSCLFFVFLVFGFLVFWFG